MRYHTEILNNQMKNVGQLLHWRQWLSSAMRASPESGRTEQENRQHVGREQRMEDAMRKGRCSHPRDRTSLPERWGYEFKGEHPQNLIHHETLEHPLSSDSKTVREADFCAMQHGGKS